MQDGLQTHGGQGGQFFGLGGGPWQELGCGNTGTPIGTGIGMGIGTGTATAIVSGFLVVVVVVVELVFDGSIFSGTGIGHKACTKIGAGTGMGNIGGGGAGNVGGQTGIAY